MITIQNLQVKEVVTLYQLKEDSYRETSRALCHGVSEPANRKEKIHGLFATESKAKQKLDSLVNQRIQEGYSKPNYAGGEQTKVEWGAEEDGDNRIFCMSIKIKPIEVNKKDIIERNRKLMYEGLSIE